jgi:hypothetical protein
MQPSESAADLSAASSANAAEAASLLTLPRGRVVLFGIIGAIALLLAFFGGRWWGYNTGFQAAYVPEHSHYIFEQKRADAFDKRIKDNRRCVDHMAHAIPPIEDGGFAALGEELRNIAMLARGMMDCNDASGFGTPSRGDLSRIIPSSNN